MNGKRMVWLAVVASALLAACGAFAEPIAWVTVGDPGNAADDTGHGAVAYSYRIGKYEITNSQYREFLNAKAAVGDPYGLYNELMGGPFYGGISRTGSGTALEPWVYSAKDGDANWNNRPVNYVSLWDIARFANWMHNGQGSGDTETGAYINIGNHVTFARQPGALFFIPTEDEWYKAAYYKGGGLNAGYWDYPTRSDTAPRSEAPPGTDLINGSANYRVGLPVEAPYYTSIVGAYAALPSSSPYGTFDQGGNVWEWNETAFAVGYRVIRGGYWNDASNWLQASFWYYHGPSDEDNGVGFRLAGSPEMAAVPEPATVSFFACIAVAAMLRRRRRKA